MDVEWLPLCGVCTMNLWKNFRWWRRLDRELDEEVRFHLSMDIRERIERGESPEDAERNARRVFGNELLIKEVTRDLWGWNGIEALGRDLRYVVRQIGRSPGFAFVSMLCMALGLGSTIAMFSIVNAVLLKPLQFREPENLYLARMLPPASVSTAGDFPVNARHFHEWQMNCQSCELSSLAQFRDVTLLGEGEPVKLPAFSVSPDFFRTLGVQPVLGRDFLPDEMGPGHSDVVILSDGLWRSRFAGDPKMIGRRIRLNGEEHTVIGVMSPDLHLPKGDEWGSHFGPAAVPVIFRPLMIDPARERPFGNLNYSAVIRLKAGVSSAQAAEELNALLSNFTREFHLQIKTVLIPMAKQMTVRYRFALWFLFAMVSAVLLIVCVNVGNLMLVRTASRYREAGVRMALGASRWQLLRLVLTEAIVLVSVGGIAGVGLAEMCLRMLVTWTTVHLPRLDEIQLDWRVLLLASVAIAVCTALCGLLPALRLSRTDPQESLKPGTVTSTESNRKVHAREVLVGVEVALSTVLLVIGGLLLFSFLRVVTVDKGFEMARIVTQDVSYLSPKYAHGERRQRVGDTVARISQISGVKIAAAINLLPLRGDDWISELEDADRSDQRSADEVLANFRFVTPGYWQAMGIPLKMGRMLNDFDRDQPRAVISERAARHLWPNQNPLGRHVRGAGGRSGLSLEVVGVVGEVRAKGLEHDPPMIVYEHYWRMQPIAMSYIARTENSGTDVARTIQAELASMDPEMAILRPWTMEEIVDESIAMRRFQMYLAVAFAMSALLLASLGIYGVISYTVARRTPEIGIRAALGASRRELMATVLARGMRPVVMGVVLGLVASLIVSRSITSQLFQVAPWDPVTFAGVAVVLLSVALAACWIPARRAARVDPIEALRFE